MWSNGGASWRSYVRCIFFFSSRRRHTRFDCDWSSDVCSSDLLEPTRRSVGERKRNNGITGAPLWWRRSRRITPPAWPSSVFPPTSRERRSTEIGRGAGRERGEISGGGGSLKKKKENKNEEKSR